MPSASDGSSSEDEADDPAKLPYPGTNYLPGFLSRANLPRGTRHFPLYVMFNPDGSVKPVYTPLRTDKRPIVILPRDMMNRPPRAPVSNTPAFTVNSTPIFPHKFYQININGATSTVPGRYIRQRRSRGGFSVKVAGQRRAIRAGYTLVEVGASGGYSTGTAAMTGGFSRGGASAGGFARGGGVAGGFSSGGGAAYGGGYSSGGARRCN